MRHELVVGDSAAGFISSLSHDVAAQIGIAWVHQTIMAARPHPSRPNHHTRMQPTHFLSRSMMEWGEDDAWDSASDDESSNPEPPIRTLSNSTSSAPKSVSNLTRSASSSTLDSSFTHLNPPNSTSYPPKPQNTQPAKNGWTIVRKSHRESIDERRGKKLEEDDNADLDVEGDMVLGDLEPDGAEPVVNVKPRQDHGSVRDDVDEIINGNSNSLSCLLCSPLIQHVDPLHGIRRRLSKHPDSSPRQPKTQVSAVNEKSEKLMRERSIRTNRRHKFVECLTSQDVNIGAFALFPEHVQPWVYAVTIAELRKLSWAGIPNDLRPIAWQLLLVSQSLPYCHHSHRKFH
jgi:hypothetical protein